MIATFRVSLSAIFAASLLAAPPSQAQMDTSLVGQRVRVHLRDDFRQQAGGTRLELRGMVTSVDTSGLSLELPRVAPPLTITRADIIRLDVSRGVPGRFQSAVQGLFGGALVGALWGVVYHALDGSRFSSDWERDVAGGAVLGAGVGVVTGAIWPVERWRRVRVR